MSLAGVIRNPKSHRNRQRHTTAGAQTDTGLLLVEPVDPAQLAATLADFAARGVTQLMIDGGDGTLRDVLGALPAAYGERWPELALCASGNTNLAAQDVGAFAHGPRAVGQFRAALASGRLRRSRRRVIEVRWPDGSRPPVFGFFIGCANYARGVQMATGSLRRSGLFHSWAVAGTIAGAAWQVLAGAEGSDWQRGSALSLQVDDAAPDAGARFVLLTTSLEKLLLGLWPFWSTADARGGLHWLDITAPAPRFAAALPALLRGKPKPWMQAGGVYRSGRADRLRLTLSESLIVDGEAYAPDANGELELRTGPEVCSLRPPDASGLQALIDAELATPVVPAVTAFAASLASAAPGAVAVLFYGSNLRSGDLDGVLDFYLLVDDLRDWHRGHALAATANRLLPPNVSYLQATQDGRPLRAKVAVLSAAQFAAGVAGQGLDTTLWARFAQPARLLWARDAESATAARQAVAAAVTTAARWAALLGPDSGTAEAYWDALFARTYAAELRVEKAARATSLVAHAPGRYRQALMLGWQAAALSFEAASADLLRPIVTPGERASAAARWRRLARWGKPLNLARLAKGVFTFEGGADYVAWKVERHSGYRLALSDWQRRHPLLAAPGVLVELWRHKVLR